MIIMVIFVTTRTRTRTRTRTTATAATNNKPTTTTTIAGRLFQASIAALTLEEISNGPKETSEGSLVPQE